MAWAGLRKCYAVGRCASVGGVSGWQTIARGRRVGAERYAQHPMTAQAVAVGALWKESEVVIPSKVRSEWPGEGAERWRGEDASTCLLGREALLRAACHCV